MKLSLKVILFLLCYFYLFYIQIYLELSSGNDLGKIKRAIGCDIIRVIIMKSEESTNDVMCIMCYTLLCYIAEGLNMKEEKDIKDKKKLVVNKLLDIFIV